MSQPSVFLVQPRELPAILRDHGFTLIDVHADAGNNTYYVAETNRNAETIVVKSTHRKHALFVCSWAKGKRKLTRSAVIANGRGQHTCNGINGETRFAMLSAIRDAVIGEFRGRAFAWKLAFVISSITLILWFYFFRPTCALMFFPSQVAEGYAIAWVWLFVFAGLTKRGKVLCGIVFVIWMANGALVQERVPTNEARTVRRLREMQATLQSGKKPMRDLTDIVNPALISNGQMHGYIFEYSPELSETGALKSYVIRARPFCYCLTGQRSFALEDNGPIHYTAENRRATLHDGVLRPD